MEARSTYQGMTNQRRELIFRAMDGNHNALPILHFISNWYRCDQIISWLIENRITGTQLCQFANKQFGNKLLSMCQFILMKLDHHNEVRPVYVGKDVYPA
jgi:hypothetical protein